MDTFKPGDFFYHWIVEQRLGGGAEGSVWRIRHKETGQQCALKTLHPQDWVDPNRVRRALVSARGSAKIDHRCVLKVLDLNLEPTGLVWMRTELLEGCTIQELLARHGRLSLPFVIAVATEAAFGLAAVHDAMILHRDLKPSNIFYALNREVKVIDFGLSKVVAEGLVTTAGRKIGIGTPAYAAPEQLAPDRTPDARADLYALGVTTYEMLAGKHPFDDVLGDVTELMRRQIAELPRPLAEIAGLPPRVDEVLGRALAKDPSERYGSAMQMARALTELGAWVAEEARAGRLVLSIPRGEPPLPGDSNTWRDYRPPVPPPVHEVPPSEPSRRVVLTPPAPDGSRAPLAETQAMSSPRAGGLAETLPLEGAPPPVPPPAAAPPAAAPPRATPTAVTRTPPHGAPAAKPRTPWAAVATAVVVVSAGTVALVVWLLGSRPAPAAPAPETAASATATVGPTAAPALSLSPEPTAAPALSPSPEPGAPVATASASPAPAASASAPRRPALPWKRPPISPGASPPAAPSPAPSPAPPRRPRFESED